MNKLTKEEKIEIIDLWGDKSCDQMIDWVEKMKELWQELAVAEYKLKKETETKFFNRGSGDNWKWKCVKCGVERGLYDAHYGTVNGFICEICRLNIEANGGKV